MNRRDSQIPDGGPSRDLTPTDAPSRVSLPITPLGQWVRISLEE